MTWDEMAADLDAEVASVMGTRIWYRTSVGDAGLYPTAMFDEDVVVGSFIEQSDAGPQQVSTSAPTLTIPRAALPFEPAVDHLIDVGARAFKVDDVRPDGASWLLVLKKARR